MGRGKRKVRGKDGAVYTQKQDRMTESDSIRVQRSMEGMPTVVRKVK